MRFYVDDPSLRKGKKKAPHQNLPKRVLVSLLDQISGSEGHIKLHDPSNAFKKRFILASVKVWTKGKKLGHSHKEEMRQVGPRQFLAKHIRSSEPAISSRAAQGASRIAHKTKTLFFAVPCNLDARAGLRVKCSNSLIQEPTLVKPGRLGTCGVREGG